MYREAVNLVYDSGCKNSKILYGSCKKVTGMDFFQLLTKNAIAKNKQDGMAQLVARLTHNVSVVSLSPIKSPRCFLELETLLLFLSTGQFHEQI